MVDNNQVRGMAQAYLDNGIFDDDTDPDGDIQAGLQFLAKDGDWDQEAIDGWIDSTNDWDGLEDWAQTLGHGVG